VVLTVVCDRPAGAIDHLILTGPDRLVLDMPGRWEFKGANVIREASGPVRHVVVGAHPDKLRFVVHFRDGVRPEAAPVVVRDGATVRVTVSVAR
jgi:hypothetical protein